MLRNTLKAIAGVFTLFAGVGWAGAQTPRSPYVVDSIPAPGNRFHVSVCFDSSGYMRVLHNVPYLAWTDTLIFRVDTADGRVLDSISIHSDCIPRGMAYAFDKFWINGGVGEPEYVYKVDTLGRVLGRFPVPATPYAHSMGICFEGDKLWVNSYLDINWISRVYQTDTLGNVLKAVRIDNDTIGIPGYLAYWPKAPGTLFIGVIRDWTPILCQVTTTDTVAALVREWPCPFPPVPNEYIEGSTFDNQGYFWANRFQYEWILKLDLGLTGVERESPSSPEFPRQVRLFSPLPMPTSSATMVRFELPSTARVLLRLVNINGGRVRLLNEGVLRAGEHRLVWDGRNDQGQRVPSGVYFLELEALGQKAFQRVVVVR